MLSAFLHGRHALAKGRQTVASDDKRERRAALPLCMACERGGYGLVDPAGGATG